VAQVFDFQRRRPFFDGEEEGPGFVVADLADRLLNPAIDPSFAPGVVEYVLGAGGDNLFADFFPGNGSAPRWK
jgi:hypothetical protein